MGLHQTLSCPRLQNQPRAHGSARTHVCPAWHQVKFMRLTVCPRYPGPQGRAYLIHGPVLGLASIREHVLSSPDVCWLWEEAR